MRMEKTKAEKALKEFVEDVYSESVPGCGESQKNVELMNALAHVMKPWKDKVADNAGRKGELWRDEENSELLGEWLRGLPVEEIAGNHKRTELAITSRFWKISPSVASFVKAQSARIQELERALEVERVKGSRELESSF